MPRRALIGSGRLEPRLGFYEEYEKNQEFDGGVCAAKWL